MKKSFPGRFSAGGDDHDALKGVASNVIALRAHTHSAHIEESVALLFSLFVALFILTVATNSGPSLP